MCQLRWDWEVAVPELDASMFIMPGEPVKNRDDRLVVLNRVARSAIEGERGMHRLHLQGRPVRSIHKSSWKRVRVAIGLPSVRVHNLKPSSGAGLAPRACRSRRARCC